MSNMLKLFTTILIAFSFTACGGGSSSNNNQETPKPKPTSKNDVKGVVVDGYIKGANVFLDENLNFIQDNGEISDKTNPNGEFVLKGAMPKIKAMGNLIVSVGGVDIDTGKEIKQTLSVSPINNEAKDTLYITPLSTIMANTAMALVAGNNFGGFTMSNFESKILDIFQITKKELQANPLTNPKVYKANQAVQRVVEVTGSSYKDFVKNLVANKSFKEAIKSSNLKNKDEAVKIVEYIESIDNNSLSKDRVKFAKEIQAKTDELIKDSNSNNSGNTGDNITPTPKPGDSGNTGDNTTPTPTPTTNKITGRVIDGYVKNSKVFLDLNLNFKFDNNEPSTTTDEYGRFSLTGFNLDDINRQNSLVAVGGIDIDTDKELKHTLTFTPNQKDIQGVIYITPASTLITNVAVKIVNEGPYNGFTLIGGFKQKVLDIIGISEDDLKKDPIANIDNPNLYKANQKIQKLLELMDWDYKELASKLNANQASLKDVTTDPNAINLINFIDNLSDTDLKEKRVGIAKKVQEAVDSKVFNLTQNDVNTLPKDGKQVVVDDFVPTPIKPTDKVIDGRFIYPYNQKAIIFLDTNKNKMLDDDEKKVQTDENGNFKIGLTSNEIAKRYRLIAINGVDENSNKEPQKTALYTTPVDKNGGSNTITPLTTFHTSAAIAVANGISTRNDVYITNFTKAVENALGVEQDKFDSDYLELPANIDLYKANMTINNIVKALAISIDNGKDFTENFIDYYILLASGVSTTEMGLDALLDYFKSNNQINQSRFDILKEILKIYKEASNNDITKGIADSKVKELLEKIKSFKDTVNVKEAQDITYQGLPKDQFSKYQWHLKDQGAVVNTNGISTLGGNDLGVDELYKKQIFGQGVKVRIVDDGLYAKHEDLVNRVSLADSHNAETKENDPTPTKDSDTHGTQVAGLISADGENNIGLRGVAPYSTISAYKLRTTSGGGLDVNTEELREAWLGGNDSISIVNNSWGSAMDKSIQEEKILEEGATNKRGGKGRIYLIAAGNGALNQGEENIFSDDAVTSYLRGSQYAIVVASARNENLVTQYSTPGSNVLVSGYGGGVKYRTAALMATTTVPGTSTTTWPEDTKKAYTFAFNGTSAATPVTSGALALVMQKCPDLTYRDVKWLIAHTAKRIDPNYTNKTKPAPGVPPYKTTPDEDLASGFGYIRNGAGLYHSNYYGYGLINPVGMIEKCTSPSFEHLPEKRTNKFVLKTTSLVGITPSIPRQKEVIKADKKKITSGKTINKIEWVGLTVYANVENLQKINLVLKSPSGTISRILTHSKTASNAIAEIELGYRFSSVAFVDEDPYGDWEVLMESEGGDQTARITKLELEIVGHERN